MFVLIQHLENLVVEPVFQQITNLGRIPTTLCATKYCYINNKHLLQNTEKKSLIFTFHAARQKSKEDF